MGLWALEKEKEGFCQRNSHGRLQAWRLLIGDRVAAGIG